MLATAGNDGQLSVYRIPEGGLTGIVDLPLCVRGCIVTVVNESVPFAPPESYAYSFSALYPL